MCAQQRNIRSDLLRDIACRISFGGFADHFDVRCLLQREHDLSAKQRGLVTDEDAYNGVVPLAFGDREVDAESLRTLLARAGLPQSVTDEPADHEAGQGFGSRHLA